MSSRSLVRPIFDSIDAFDLGRPPPFLDLLFVSFVPLEDDFLVELEDEPEDEPELLAEADMLGPGYKEIVAYLLDDYSWAEIGRIMGLSKQVMHKRKMRLAKKFEYLKK